MAKFEFNEAGCTFIPDLTIAREGDLRDFAGEFESLSGRINGRSGEVFTEFNSASFEYSDLFAWQITGEAEYDRSRWQEATMAVFFLVGVVREWADAVDDYKTDRGNIIDTWGNEEAWHLKNISVAEATEEAGDNGWSVQPLIDTGGRRWSSTRSDAVARYREAFDEHKGIAKRRWDDFQEKAEEIGDKLKEGATEDNIRALQDAGYMKWAPFNIMGGVYDKPALPEMQGRVPAAGSSPEEVNNWWNSLTVEERDAVMESNGDDLRMLDGIPSEVRDQLNREHLDEELPRIKEEYGEDSTEYLELQKLKERTLQEEDTYLLALDTSGDVGRAITSKGNPDTADNVATLVPGTDTDWMSVNGQFGRADRLHGEATEADPDAEHAVISWIGYDAPTASQAPFSDRAEAGATELLNFQAGLEATGRGSEVNRTLVGHSYGTTVIGHALQADHRAEDDGSAGSGRSMDVDNVIAVGSPGMGVSHVSELGIPSENVHASRGDKDWIGITPEGVHGVDPYGEDFGSRTFESEGYGHSDYFNEEGSPTLVYMGGVVAGTR